MAYQRPLVLVYQEYAKLSVATQVTSLLPCVIGPCYHIIDVEDDALLALAGDITSLGLPLTDFPNNVAGAVIDEDSVKVKIDNVVVAMNAAPEVGNGMADNVVSFADALSYPAYAAVGDIVDVLDADNADEEVLTDARIIAIDPDAFTITLNRTAATASINLKVNIRREVADIDLAYDDPNLTISNGQISILTLTVSAGGQERTVISGKVYIGYKALRQDLSDIGTVYNTDELKAAMGKIVPENPLAYGVAMVLANTTTGVKYIGVDTDDTAGYTATLDRLETDDDVYALVPLSQSAAITAMFKNHAEQMSLPENGKRRVAIVSSPLMTTKDLASGTCKIVDDGGGLPG